MHSQPCNWSVAKEESYTCQRLGAFFAQAAISLNEQSYPFKSF